MSFFKKTYPTLANFRLELSSFRLSSEHCPGCSDEKVATKIFKNVSMITKFVRQNSLTSKLWQVSLLICLAPIIPISSVMKTFWFKSHYNNLDCLGGLQSIVSRSESFTFGSNSGKTKMKKSLKTSCLLERRVSLKNGSLA